MRWLHWDLPCMQPTKVIVLKLSSAQKDKIGKFKFVQERTSKSYGTIVVNKDRNGQPTAKNSVLIEKNSKIPCSVTKSLLHKL